MIETLILAFSTPEPPFALPESSDPPSRPHPLAVKATPPAIASDRNPRLP